jgi:UDP-N-acetylmuramoylalanine--D-glutamate ligase
MTDIAILNRDDKGAWDLRPRVKGRLASFGLSKDNLSGDGSYTENGALFFTANGHCSEICKETDIHLRGKHNLMNVLAACAIAIEMGISSAALRKAVQHFSGVPHRLEFVKEIKGAKWYNDSIATAPERTIAAVNAFDDPIVLMLGGKDKDLPWERLADLIHEKVDHVIIFGAAKEKILSAIRSNSAHARPFSVTATTNLLQAVLAAYEISEAGDVVLLSPGGTSYDEFKDFEERGEKFRLWVQQLQ